MNLIDSHFFSLLIKTNFLNINFYFTQRQRKLIDFIKQNFYSNELNIIKKLIKLFIIYFLSKKTSPPHKKAGIKIYKFYVLFINILIY